MVSPSHAARDGGSYGAVQYRLWYIIQRVATRLLSDHPSEHLVMLVQHGTFFVSTTEHASWNDVIDKGSTGRFFESRSKAVSGHAACMVAPVQAGKTGHEHMHASHMT